MNEMNEKKSEKYLSLDKLNFDLFTEYLFLIKF